MNRPRPTPKVMLVEGKDEQRVLPELLEVAGVPWPARDPPVWIEETNGIETMMSTPVIETELKISGLRVLGVVVDDSALAASRWSYRVTRSRS